MASNIARPSLIKGAPLDCESCVTQSMQPSDRNLMQLLNWEKKCKAIQPLDEMDKILATLDTRMAAIEGWLDDHDGFFKKIASVSQPPLKSGDNNQ